METVLPTISALGTSWWIEVFDDINEERRQAIRLACAAFLYTFEKRYSRFNKDSYISILNKTGQIQNPDLPLRTLLSFGIAQYERTGGAFNIMVGSRLIETGYDSSYSFTPSEVKTPIAMPKDALTVHPDKIILTTGQVDIGGFGKGYAIDALRHMLQTEFSLQYFLINGGGDMYATSNYGKPITIYLEHPTETNLYIATTTLLHQGFAASSPHKRSWTYGGDTYSHIINTSDTATTKIDGTFIKARTACDADIFATVALLVPTQTMDQYAQSEQLGIAHFSLVDQSLTHNQAFV